MEYTRKNDCISVWSITIPTIARADTSRLSIMPNCAESNSFFDSSAIRMDVREDTIPAPVSNRRGINDVLVRDIIHPVYFMNFLNRDLLFSDNSKHLLQQPVRYSQHPVCGDAKPPYEREHIPADI